MDFSDLSLLISNGSEDRELSCRQSGLPQSGGGGRRPTSGLGRGPKGADGLNPCGSVSSSGACRNGHSEKSRQKRRPGWPSSSSRRPNEGPDGVIESRTSLPVWHLQTCSLFCVSLFSVPGSARPSTRARERMFMGLCAQRLNSRPKTL